jgi:hypothetical protein
VRHWRVKVAARLIGVGCCLALALLSLPRAGKAGDVRRFAPLSYKEWLRVSGDTTGGNLGRRDGFDIEHELNKEIVLAGQLSRARQVVREWLIRNLRNAPEVLNYALGGSDMGTFWRVGLSYPDHAAVDCPLEFDVDKESAAIIAVSCSQ